MSSPSGELIAADRPSVGAVAGALGAQFGVRAGDPVSIERVYLDTFDGLLHARALTLRWERGRLELLDDGAELPRAVALAREPTRPIPFDELPYGALRDAVVDVIDVRAVLPLARVRIGVQPLAVLDGLEKTVARMTLVTPELAELGGAAALRERVRLIAVRGYERDLTRARELIVRGLGLVPADETLREEAMRIAGHPPAGVSAKVDVALDPSARADVATVTVLRRLVEIMDATLPGAIADIDSEFLHDYRVAVRRTRSVQRECKRVFPPDTLARMRAEFRWLQQATGDTRDLDVYVLDFEAMRALVPADMRTDLEPLLDVLRARRRLARAQMVGDLRSARATALRRDWLALLAALPGLPPDDRPDAARAIDAVASARIRAVYRAMVKAGRRIGPDTPPEDYHELRKRGKELRYLLELFGRPLHDPGVVSPMIKTLKGLQDVLGHHQDREVQMAMLRGLATEVSQRPGGPGAVLAMGVLVDRLGADARAARQEFAAVFAQFAGKAQLARVKATFPA